MRKYVVVMVALAGCASYQSSYRRSRVDASELVWAYDNKLQVTRSGKVVAEQRDWDGLPEAVICVPRARAWAESAASRDGTGKLLTWTGFSIMMGSLVAGSVLVFRDVSNTDDMLLGVGVMGGGLLVGLPIGGGGLVMRARADTTAIDAVNVYNDERGACPR
jgi:hypothetical protein